MGTIGIKKIDQLLLRSFITTFISLFALVLFVLVIQHFFIILKDIAGKGLGVDIYAKLLFYIGLGVFPSAFPLAVLVASLIVFGNFSESFELTAMRSVGLSLQRIFRFPFLFILFLSGALFYFQNYIHPTTTPKMFALIGDVCKKKSALFIQEGIFCSNIPGYGIRVNKKLGNNGEMEGIIVYDHTKQYGTVAITIAEKGRLYTTPDGSCLIMELSNGHNYIEPLLDKSKNYNRYQNQSFYRSNFTNQKIKISLEALKLGNTSSGYAYDHRTRIRPELKKMIEERKQKIVDEENYSKRLLARHIAHYIVQKPSNQSEENSTELLKENLHESASLKNVNFRSFRSQLMECKMNSNIAEQADQNDHSLRQVIRRALNTVEQTKTSLISQRHDELLVTENLNSALFEREHRLAVTIRCIIMFLLAAPLGCIIRRGGFGISVMISFFFILVEYILSMFGKDWAMTGTLSAFVGAWLANFTLLPFCFFFLAKAQQGTDLSLINDYYALWIKLKRFIKRKTPVNRPV
jgi:lipopolysaccharide export system permease protein